MATSMHMAWKQYNSHRLLQATLTHLYGNTQRRCCHMTAQTITPTQAKLRRIKRDIKIPMKKKRDSLSVLRALSEVAGKDHTLPDYKPAYTEDRFLIPHNQISTAFRFALTSGRVSAQYFIQSFPECFDTKKGVPHIPAFEPTHGRAKLEDVSEEALQERIQINLVSDAIQMYEKIIKAGDCVSVATLEDLIEMIMYSFGEDRDNINDNPLNLQVVSQRTNRPPPSSQFVDTFISRLTMEKTPRMYKSIILGYCKHEMMEVGLAYYKEMKSKGFRCDRDIFHALLSKGSKYSTVQPLPAHIAVNLLRDMKTEGIVPTEETFSRLVSGPGSESTEISFFTTVLSEMKALGLKPSLTMCSAFLKFAKREPGFQQILNYVENENIKATSEEEMNFFRGAMRTCEIFCKSPVLALEVDRLFKTLGEGHYFETVMDSKAYYRSFFLTFLKNEKLDNIMELYNRLFPHKLQPVNVPMQAIWRLMKQERNYHHLPKLVRDTYIARKKIDMIQDPLELMDDVTGPMQLLEELSDVFEEIKADLKRFSLRDTPNRTWSELNFCAAANRINLKAGHIERAWDDFELGENYEIFKEAQCVELHQKCLDKDDADKAERVENYMTRHNIRRRTNDAEEIINLDRVGSLFSDH